MFKKILIITLMIMVASMMVAGSKSRKFHENHYKEQFMKWTRKKNLLFASEHFLKRYENFKDNFDYIEDWNQNSNSDTVLGLNDYADLSNQEYRQLYLGTNIDASGFIEEEYHNTRNNIFNNDDDLPNHLDWRIRGAVSHVKNQGQCGSCYTFSTTGSLEGANFIATGKMTTLSEQQLVDCTRDYENEGCDGGLMIPSFQYIIDNGGINTEEAYPYIGKESTCKFNPSQIGAKMSAIGNVTRGSEESLLRAIQIAPVAVAIDAGQRSFQLYKSGVYYDSGCSRIYLSHAVLLVGYGTDETSVIPDYYIIKNSWGTEWGDQGYIYMARNMKNSCGVATMASYPII